MKFETPYVLKENGITDITASGTHRTVVDEILSKLLADSADWL